MTRDVQVIASREGDELVGFAQLVRSGGAARSPRSTSARSTVAPAAAPRSRARRSRRPATSTTSGSPPTTRTGPKELYARLGFRPAWTSIEFLRAPGIAGWTG